MKNALKRDIMNNMLMRMIGIESRKAMLKTKPVALEYVIYSSCHRRIFNQVTHCRQRGTFFILLA